MKRTTLLGTLFAVAMTVLSVPARAFEVEIRVHTPPPAVRVEAIPPAPSPGHYWIGGHWAWERNSWAWVGGHWAEARPGQVWIRAHWARVGDDWLFRPGHWAQIVPPQGYAEVVADVPPPIAKVEVVTPAPSPDHFWIPGYWRWAGGVHVWVPGRWELSRRDQVWAPEHWARVGGRWHFYGGHWQRY
ncbi:MAG TPA: hypothetical protein VKY89_05615 [Thermoanaerobaculia bacterium]|jgi:hypothetical protein|nr:hypothetical protein [Thermoanaerobaculia bacterium]